MNHRVSPRREIDQGGHGKMFLRHSKILKYGIVGLLVSIGMQDLSFAETAGSRTYAYEKVSQKGKDAIATFKAVYRKRLDTEMAHRDEASRKEIIEVFEKCINLGYDADLKSANKLLVALDKKYPDEPVILWHLAVNYFMVARRLGEDFPAQRPLLEQGILKTARCLEIAPDNPDCHLSYAASRGASAIAHGIFSTISQISEIEKLMLHAHKVTKAKPFPMAPFGISSFNVATGALAEFYRLVPDWWIFKVLAGVRGDKAKAWSYAKTMPVKEIGSTNIVARAALCEGARSEDQKLIDKSMGLIVQGIEMDLMHPFDEPEFNRLGRLYDAIGALKDPSFDDYFELGCYEFGNDDKSKLE